MSITFPYKLTLVAVIATASALLSSCATQPKPIETVAPDYSVQEQRAAQEAALKESQTASPSLKRKVAIGRVTNETNHGRSLLRTQSGDPLGKQVADMLSQKLIESGQFIVLERPDLHKLEAEANLSKSDLNIVGTDTLILGSLVEFGRSTTGTKGFWSKTKKQSANAKVAFRLVDTSNARAYFSATGAGEATSETGEVAFAGSTASYDGTLNDGAIDAAISDVVDEIIRNLSKRPWHSIILSQDQDGIFIGAGESQGVHANMTLAIELVGKKIKSPQTGFMITLPGKKVATVEVISLFGDNETNEGALVRLTSGNISQYSIDQLRVIEHE